MVERIDTPFLVINIHYLNMCLDTINDPSCILIGFSRYHSERVYQLIGIIVPKAPLTLELISALVPHIFVLLLFAILNSFLEINWWIKFKAVQHLGLQVMISSFCAIFKIDFQSLTPFNKNSPFLLICVMQYTCTCFFSLRKHFL